MKRLRILTAAFIGLLSFAGFAQAAGENEVTPELAKKAAAYFFYTNVYGSSVETENEVKFSEPKKFYNYDDTKFYYVVFAYFGKWHIPTWAQLETDMEIYNPLCWSFIIPGTQKELPGWPAGKIGIPEAIRQLEPSKHELQSRFRSAKKIKYVKTVIQGSIVIFVFDMDGVRKMVSCFPVGVYDASPNVLEAAPPDQERYERATREIWGEIKGFSYDE